MSTRWWWIRHAPVVGHGGRIYGNHDVACDTSDDAAFASLASRLPGDAAWVTSHLGRARATAAALAAALAARGHAAPEPVVEPDLAEQNLGAWQGRSHAELERSGDAAYHKFWIAPAHHAPPGGESFAAVVARVATAVERLSETCAGGDVVAVAHGGSIRAALACALGLDPETALAFRVDNLSLTRLERVDGPGTDGRWRVVVVNLPPK